MSMPLPKAYVATMSVSITIMTSLSFEVKTTAKDAVNSCPSSSFAAGAATLSFAVGAGSIVLEGMAAVGNLSVVVENQRS